MHNFWTALRFELVRTLKKPTFWLGILSVPALIAVVVAVIFFSRSSTETAQNQINQEPFSLVILDESGVLTDQATAQLDARTVENKQAGIEQVKKGEVDAFFYYPQNLVEDPVEIYNQNEGLTNNSKYSSSAKALITSAATTNVAPELLAAATGSVAVEQSYIENGEFVNPFSRAIAPAIFLLIFYALIVLLGGQMLTSTTEEKENRVTEMLLTSLSSRALIVAKIVSLIILGVIQILVILIPVVVAYFTIRENLNIPDLAGFIGTIQIELWPTLLGVALLITGFLLFTGLLVGIGAAMPTAKEANSFFGFVILLMVVPFWFASLLIIPGSSPIVTALSYFPLTAPFTLLIRNAAGTLSLHEAIIGLVILTISSIIAISLAVRIFRFGTLEYGNRLSLKTLFNHKKTSTITKA